MESSDAQITVEPGEGTVELTIESSVIHQLENRSERSCWRLLTVCM